MSNETLFYVFGIALAVSAVIFSFAGLKLKGFPGKAFPIVVLWFVVLIAGATTYSVLNGQDEEVARAAELEEANEKIEAAQGSEPFEEEEAEEEAGAEEAGGEEAEPAEEGGASAGGGSTLQLAADTTTLAFDTDSLEAEAGEVTIDFDNPAAIEHDVAIDSDGEQLAKSETITEGKTSVSAELGPGTYTFLCTVPGHAQAGMEGTLTVK
ncbi:MAG TPA: plastocyanin/azurin family copper-binding protein [Solirubrobacterales bacterium]|nr:plastocyanin/azurin family copper-binding protein [Solirubrobacterales bacterium]